MRGSVSICLPVFSRYSFKVESKGKIENDALGRQVEEDIKLVK